MRAITLGCSSILPAPSASSKAQSSKVASGTEVWCRSWERCWRKEIPGRACSSFASSSCSGPKGNCGSMSEFSTMTVKHAPSGTGNKLPADRSRLPKRVLHLDAGTMGGHWKSTTASRRSCQWSMVLGMAVQIWVGSHGSAKESMMVKSTVRRLGSGCWSRMTWNWTMSIPLMGIGLTTCKSKGMSSQNQSGHACWKIGIHVPRSEPSCTTRPASDQGRRLWSEYQTSALMKASMGKSWAAKK